MKLPLSWLDTRPRSVAPGFWLGGREAPGRPPEEGDWAVIVRCTASVVGGEGAHVIECAIEDGERWDPSELSRVFDELARARAERPGPVLIHCSAGVSRSVAMATYLLTRLGVFGTAEQALTACRYSSLPFLGPRRRTWRSAVEALVAHSR